MNSATSSPTQALIFSLEIPGKLSSWNEILAMHHWKRKKFKDDLAKSFLSALQASERGLSTKTICAENTTAIFAATHLEEYLEMKREKQKLRLRNARLKRAKKKKR